MNDQRTTSFPTFSRPVPGWLVWPVFLVLVLAIARQAVIIRDFPRELRTREMMKSVKFCERASDGDRRALIATIGIMAAENPPGYANRIVADHVPGARGMNEAVAAEWIATNFHRLTFDMDTREFRIQSEATTHP